MSQEEQVDQNTVDWILKSPKKLEILKALDEEKMTPSELAEEFDVELTTMSNHLSQMRKGEWRMRQSNSSGSRTTKRDSSVSPVVEEVTGRQRDRIYSLTPEGREILQEIDI